MGRHAGQIRAMTRARLREKARSAWESLQAAGPRRCPVLACAKEVPRWQLLCGDCLDRLPNELRRRILAAEQLGRGEFGMHERVKAVLAAVTWLERQ